MSSFRSEALNGISPFLVVNYGQTLSTEHTNEILVHSGRILLDRLTPEGWIAAGLYIADCFTLGNVLPLCDYDPDILDLGHHDQYLIRQVLGFFKKRSDLELGIDRREVAANKFVAAERACRLTNQCFRAWSQGRFQFRPDVEGVLHSSLQKISSLLGPAPSVSDIRLRFGPGASTQTPKKNACTLMKLRNMPACSPNVDFGHLSELLEPFVQSDLAFVHVPMHPAKIAFVPKSAKEDRAICTEPQLNGAYQLGVGELLAARLRRVGIDIRDQSANQRAALYGSINGNTATIDLSSASDTVALGLVEHLFPLDWVDLFRSLRSAEARLVDGEPPVRLEKLSSMGNGFTFPVETIIFWALAQSCVERFTPKSRYRTLVYGDDIIVDVGAALPLMAVLRDLGFTPNPSKSFWTGSFRESCGCDYHFGSDVRPVFVGGALTGADLYTVRNFFYRRGDYVVASALESYIDPAARKYGPDGYGDGVLVSSSYSLQACRKGGWGGSTFESFGFSRNSLANNLRKSMGTTVRYYPPKWEDGVGWVPGRQLARGFVYHANQYALVRRLATYTQYTRETRKITLTESDELRARGEHVYADRRMPDPTVRQDSDFHIVPGTGNVCVHRIYIFESSTD